MATYTDLHLSAPLGAALETLGWAADDPAAREAVPTTARGHNLVAVAPPDPVYATPALAGVLTRLGEGRRGLVLAGAAELDRWSGIAHALARELPLRIRATAGAGSMGPGSARALRQLRAGTLDLLIATPDTALRLVRQSALKLDEIAAVVLGWPETWSAADEAVAAIMQDLPREAQRVIFTALPGSVTDLVERYARRALTVGTPPAETAEPAPVGPVRTVTVARARRAAALAAVAELLDPGSLTVWTADRSEHEAIARAVPLGDPDVHLATGDAPAAAVVVAYDLPSRARLEQLLAAGGEVVLLVPPSGTSFVARIAAPQRPLQLPGLAEDLAEAAAARRAAIAKMLDAGVPERAVLLLAPLFERYDPVAVAAALYELWTATPAPAAPVPDTTATARVYVGVGKKDGATPNDLVAVLVKELHYDRAKIGRIELRDAFTLVELPAEDAERIATALNGVTIRRRRVNARLDRGATRPPARSTRPRRESTRPTKR